ncbi:MAG: hypothetical protein HY455_02375 [Parcubacteria group bacterium]|nr:hypothetical protein [Parcubacteria group bacterium]
MKSNKLILIALTALVLVVPVGYFVYTTITKQQIPTATTQNVDGEDVQEGGIVGENTDKAPGIKDNTTQVATIAIPNLDRSFAMPASMSTPAKVEMASKINALVTSLKQDPTLFNVWVDLGLFLKEIEDYEGALEAWEYASAIRPNNSLSFGNLGVLYGYYLKNPVMAEKNYLKAIENDPKLPYLYTQTADFYLEVMKAPEKARAILKKGVAEIPGETGLQTALADL